MEEQRYRNRVPRPELSHLSVAILLLRRSLRLSQKEFGKMIDNVSQWSVSMWEQGIHQPSPHHLSLLDGVCRDYTGRRLFRG